MRPINSNEIRIELNRNILIFNTITDTDVPLFYPICTEPKPDLRDMKKYEIKYTY
jgi:hypothetical protein